jgi:hypothetical protein
VSAKKPPANLPSTSDEEKKEAQAVKNAVDDFERTIEIASENDLFTKQSDVKFDDLEKSVQEALSCLSASPVDVITARSEFAKAYDSFNTAVRKAGFFWRVQYAFAIPYFLYLVGILAAFLLLVLFVKLPPTPTLLPVPKRAFMWGMIGSVLQGFWWLWGQVSDRHFRKSWIVWFLAVPFIGALLGGIMYLAFSVGVVAATKTTLQDPSVPLLLAALAGFSWKWAVGVLDNLTKLFDVKK